MQISDARKIYGQTIGGEAWSAIQITTAAGLCAVVDLYSEGKLVGQGLMRQEQVEFEDFLDNRFGQHYKGSNIYSRYMGVGDFSEADHDTPRLMALLATIGRRPCRWPWLAEPNGRAGSGATLSVRSRRSMAAELARFAAAGVRDVGLAVESARQAFLAVAARAGAACAANSCAGSASGCASTRRIWPMLVTLESGKILAEAAGEVQEMIDICDFAVGLSRQLYGLTIASERPGHRLAEQWHPLGPVGVITAFNFPVAVWAWNAMLALVCGDTLVWKPSEKTPLCAIACHQIVVDVLADLPRRAARHCKSCDRRWRRRRPSHRRLA